MRRKAAPRLPRLEEFETTPQPYRSARGVASGRLGQAGPRSLHANAAQTPQTRAGRGGNEARQGVAGEQQAAPSHHRLPRFPSSRHGAWPSPSRRFGRSRHRSGKMPQGDHLASVGRVSGPHRGQARSEPALQLQAQRLKEAHSRQGHLRPLRETSAGGGAAPRDSLPPRPLRQRAGLRPHRHGGTLAPGQTITRPGCVHGNATGAGKNKTPAGIPAGVLSDALPRHRGDPRPIRRRAAWCSRRPPAASRRKAWAGRRNARRAAGCGRTLPPHSRK